MRRIATMALVSLIAAACGDTDVANRGEEIQPGQEVEDRGAELDVEAVKLDTLDWVREGGTLEFDGRVWFPAGDPVFDPAVEYVGESEGTPLYAEVGVASPPAVLYIPLERDYWQRLERGQGPTD